MTVKSRLLTKAGLALGAPGGSVQTNVMRTGLVASATVPTIVLLLPTSVNAVVWFTYPVATPVLSINFMLARPQPSSPFGSGLVAPTPPISCPVRRIAALTKAGLGLAPALPAFQNCVNRAATPAIPGEAIDVPLPTI